MNNQEQDEILDNWLTRHRGLLLKVARSFASQSNDRDDLLQEIVLQVWRSIRQYKAEVTESTWIYRVALYTAISWHRKESKRNQHHYEIAPEEIADPSRLDPRVEWLYEKIAELGPIDRALALLLLDGFSYREMSQTLGMTQSNVGVRINRIKQQLTTKHHRENTNDS